MVEETQWHRVTFFDRLAEIVGEYVKKGLIRELEPFLANTALADPAFDLKDIVPAYREISHVVG